MPKGRWTAVMMIAVIVSMAAAVGGGCAVRKLAFTEATVVPFEVAVGKSSILRVNISDPRGIVNSVIATVREVPEMEIELYDDGLEGDETTGDGVWSFRLNVPPTAAPGTYHFDIRAYDETSAEIMVKRDAGVYVPLYTQTSVTIVY